MRADASYAEILSTLWDPEFRISPIILLEITIIKTKYLYGIFPKILNTLFHTILF